MNEFSPVSLRKKNDVMMYTKREPSLATTHLAFGRAQTLHLVSWFLTGLPVLGRNYGTSCALMQISLSLKKTF